MTGQQCDCFHLMTAQLCDCTHDRAIVWLPLLQGDSVTALTTGQKWECPMTGRQQYVLRIGRWQNRRDWQKHGWGWCQASDDVLWTWCVGVVISVCDELPYNPIQTILNIQHDWNWKIKHKSRLPISVHYVWEMSFFFFRYDVRGYLILTLGTT